LRLISEFTEIDLDETLSDEEKDKKRNRTTTALRRQANGFTHFEFAPAYCVFDKDVQYVVEENKVSLSMNSPPKMPDDAGAMVTRRWSKEVKSTRDANAGGRSRSRIIRLYQKLAGMDWAPRTKRPIPRHLQV